MFTRVCSLDDLWEGDMESFEVAGKEILVIHADGGDLYAVQGICPHQEIPLEQGTLRAKTLTCRAHLWQFDVATGNGINPEDCRLAVFRSNCAVTTCLWMPVPPSRILRLHNPVSIVPSTGQDDDEDEQMSDAGSNRGARRVGPVFRPAS